MAISVSTALEFDRKSTSNHINLIEENNTSDGCFIVSFFLEQAVKNKNKIILLLFHNSVGHYYSIGQKLGYNLSEYKESGNLIIYDFLKLTSDKLSSNDIFLKKEDILKSLYMEMNRKIHELSESNDVTLIIDNIGNLLLLGYQFEYVLSFVHYCRTLLSEIKNFSITILTHNIGDCEDFQVFVNSLRHVSNLNVILDDLKTGKAVDVSGKLKIQWRTADLTGWSEPNVYHYQLLDKNVNVFAPGTKHLQ